MASSELSSGRKRRLTPQQAKAELMATAQSANPLGEHLSEVNPYLLVGSGVAVGVALGWSARCRHLAWIAATTAARTALR